MLVLIIYTFTISVYNASTAVKDTLNMAPIAIVDEDHSTLSERISSAFYPPNFISKTTTLGTMDAGMDAGNLPLRSIFRVISSRMYCRVMQQKFRSMWMQPE